MQQIDLLAPESSLLDAGLEAEIAHRRKVQAPAPTAAPAAVSGMALSDSLEREIAARRKVAPRPAAPAALPPATLSPAAVTNGKAASLAGATTRFCTGCGSPVEAHHKFCAICGTPVGASAAAPSLADANGAPK